MEIESLPTAGPWSRIGLRHHHGVALPLSALRTKESCGIGEYLDLVPLIHWCREVGMDVIQLLPVNDTGEDASPYNGVSAVALNPTFISLSALPGMGGLGPLRQRCRSQRVNYRAVRKAKLKLLKRYFEANGADDAALDAFIADNPWLSGYVRFLDPDSEAPRFWEWLQYICHTQLRAASSQAKAHGVLLMGDLPILISGQSADVWEHPGLFDTRFTAGAPPDIYSAKGQNWGFPIYNWEAHFASDFAWWRERLRTAQRYYDLFRLDHLVGFFRLWAIPPGHGAKDGSLHPIDFGVQMEQGEKILRRLIEATSMLPIGEDLGVVPDEVREIMAQLGIPGTRVVRWERCWDEEDEPYIAGEHYPEMGLTTVSTHDSEPLQLWWERYQKDAKQYARQHGWEYTKELSSEQLHHMLAESHATATLFHINPLQEYLALFPELVWGAPEEERINVPGTSSNANWSYRLYPSLEEMAAHEGLKKAVWELIR